MVALIFACQLADTDEANMSLEELIDDWHGLDLAEEAVVVVAPDGRIVGYADVLNRSYVAVSVYGYVHPDYREQGIGSFLVGWGERWTRDRMTRAPRTPASSRSTTSTPPTAEPGDSLKAPATRRYAGCT